MAGSRRQYSAEFKAKVVLQLLGGDKRSAELCRVHKLNANLLNRWHKEFLEQAASIFEREAGSNEAEQRIAKLERLVGQMTMQLEIAKRPQTT